MTAERDKPRVVTLADGRRRVYPAPSQKVICHVPEDYDPHAEIRDSETGEVIFPAVKAPFRLVKGDDHDR